MRIRRLGWAGVEIECDDQTLVIDYVQDTSPMAPLLRSPDEPFPPASRPGGTAVALLTHLHADHADADALAVALSAGAPVFRPEAATGDKDDVELTSIGETKFTHHQLATEIVGTWAERIVGPFRMFSAPAVDGFGDPQHSWVVECDGHRIIHAGDTLFHGNWWRIAHRFKAFDVAFLPINAPVCNWPHLQPARPDRGYVDAGRSGGRSTHHASQVNCADPLRLTQQAGAVRRDTAPHRAPPDQGEGVRHSCRHPEAGRMVRPKLIRHYGLV